LSAASSLARIASSLSQNVNEIDLPVDRSPKERTPLKPSISRTVGMMLSLKIYRSPHEIVLGRAALWGQQVVVDAEDGDLEAVTGDIAVLGWIRNRFVHAVDELAATHVDALLLALGEGVADEDLAATSRAGRRLTRLLESIHPNADSS
jgi:hypothetical protein